MSFIAVGIGVAVVAGGLSAYSAYQEGEATTDAYNQMIAGVGRIEKMNPDKLKSLVEQGDKDAYTRRLEFARLNDPELYNVRQQAVKKLADIYGQKEFPWEVVDRGLTNLAMEDTTSRKALEDKFLAKANEQLDLGGKLGPEFQQELIRSGLEAGSTTGVGTNKTGPLAQLLGNKIGAAQVQLEQTRLQNAMAAAGAADTIKANRANILHGILPDLMKTTQFKTELGAAGLRLFDAEIPKIGLNGTDLANMEEQRRNQANDLTLKLAGLQANKTMAEAQADSNFYSSIGSGLTSIAGAAAGGGGMGGGGGMLSGLFSGNTGTSGSGITANQMPVSFSTGFLGMGPTATPQYSNAYGTYYSPAGGGANFTVRTPQQMANYNYISGLYQ